MRHDPFFHNWHKIKHKAKAHWVKLTDEDLAEIEERNHLVHALQKRYGFEHKQAMDELLSWENSFEFEEEEG